MDGETGAATREDAAGQNGWVLFSCDDQREQRKIPKGKSLHRSWLILTRERESLSGSAVELTVLEKKIRSGLHLIL